MSVHWYNKFHNKRPVQTSLFVVHGPTRTGLKQSGCSPTISGVGLDSLQLLVAPFGGQKPDQTRPNQTKPDQTRPNQTCEHYKCVFSKGQILLSHLRNHLLVQSTQALMCLGTWSLMGYVWDGDVKSVTMLPELKEDKEEEPLKENWDLIQ
jgi:hypothetical protein